MAKLPQEFIEAWQNMAGAAVLTTVDNDKCPNSVWVACMKLYSDEKIVIADNYFDKTRANILAGSSGSFLIIDNNRKAYQVKGSFEYHTQGEIFDDMQTWKRADLPGVAAVVLNVCEVWSGSKKIS